jgi:hypothetical protein
VRVEARTLDQLAARKLPAISAHLAKLDSSVAALLAPWLPGAFSSVLPPEVCPPPPPRAPSSARHARARVQHPHRRFTCLRVLLDQAVAACRVEPAGARAQGCVRVLLAWRGRPG